MAGSEKQLLFITVPAGRRYTDVSWKSARHAGRRRPFADHFESPVGLEYTPVNPLQAASCVMPALGPLTEWRQDVTIGAHARANYVPCQGRPGANPGLDYIAVPPPGKTVPGMKRERTLALALAASAPDLSATTPAQATPTFRRGGGIPDGNFGWPHPISSMPKCGSTLIGLNQKRPPKKKADVLNLDAERSLSSKSSKTSLPESEQIRRGRIRQFYGLDTDHSGELDLDEMLAGAPRLGMDGATAKKFFEETAGVKLDPSEASESSKSSKLSPSLHSNERRNTALHRTAKDRRALAHTISLRQWVDAERRFPFPAFR